MRRALPLLAIALLLGGCTQDDPDDTLKRLGSE